MRGSVNDMFTLFANGAVWLNADRLSPYDYWQYWRNSADADVGRFLRLFTELPEDEVSRLEALQGAEINDAKAVLANQVTAMCHGDAAAAAAAQTAQKTFAEGGAGDDLPRIDIPKIELDAGIVAFELIRREGLAKSNGEARRLIKGGGARINDVAVKDESAEVSARDINDDGFIKVSAGRKRHALVVPTAG